MIDSESGRVLYEKNCSSRMLIASTTKIMTAIVAVENSNLNDVVTITREDVAIEGSSMYLKEGEQITVEALLYGLMLRSGNDAALALARHAGGGVESFIRMMNDKSAELGLEDTCYENPNGLDGENQYSSAHDLAVLTSYCMKNQVFSRVVSTKTVDIAGRHMVNHNKMLWNYSGATGVKTGFTKSSGRTLVTCAERDGLCLITVTLNAPDDWDDHKCMLDYGFENFRDVVICDETELVYKMPLMSGSDDSVGIYTAQAFSYAVSPSESVSREIFLRPFDYAPVEAGGTAGKMVYYINGEKIGEVGLVYGKTVSEKPAKKFGIFNLFN